MKVKKILAGLVMGVFIWSSVFLSGAIAADVLKIGVCGPLTGGASILCLPGLQAMEMAAEKINTAGGWDIGGKKYQIELISYDTKMDPKEAITAVKRLIYRDKVGAIIGPTGNAETLACVPLSNENKLPMLTYIAPADTILGPKNKYMFRGTDTATLESWAVSYLMAEKLGLKKIVLFGRNAEYLTTHAKNEREILPKFGAELIEAVLYPVDSLDYTPQMNQINRLKPDGTFALVYIADQMFTTVRQLVEKDIKGPIIGSDTFVEKDFLTDAKKEVTQIATQNGLYAYTLVPVDAMDLNGRNKWFFDDYQARYKEVAVSFALHGYDSLMLILEGFKVAGTTDTEKVTEALRTKVVYDGLRYKGQKFNEIGQLNVFETFIKITPDLTLEVMGTFGYEDIKKYQNR